jgi:Prophage tail length tape measure protein
MTTARVGIDITAKDSSGPAFESAIGRINKLDKSAGNMINRQRNLAFQLNDIVATLGNGASPMSVLMQQGPQIAQIYGFGNGGVAQAFKDVGGMIGLAARRFGPLAAVAGLVASGLTYEVNRASGASYSLGEVFAATGDVIWETVTNQMQPAISAIAPFISDTLNWGLDHFKSFNNKVIGGWNAAFHIIKRVAFSIPDVFKIAGMNAANFFIDGVDRLVQGTISGVNMVNRLLGLDEVGGAAFSLQGFKFDTASAKASLKKVWDGGFKELVDDFNYDYLGRFYEKVGNAAAKNKAALLKKVAPASALAGRSGRAGRGSASAGGADVATGFGFENIEQEVTIWTQLADLGKAKFTDMFTSIVDGSMSVGKAFKAMAKSMLAEALKLFANQAMQKLFSGGGGFGSAGGGLYGSAGGGGFLTSLIGSFFGGFRAGGGGVSSGKGYVVGERGPEWFEPGTNGFITPGHAMGTNSAGGGMRVQVNNYGSSNVRTTRDGDGGLRIDIVEAVSQVIAGGGANKAMRAQFGLTPGRTPR